MLLVPVHLLSMTVKVGLPECNIHALDDIRTAAGEFCESVRGTTVVGAS